jgi:tetratricopeptide (TPR) repeat protein
MLGTSLHFQLVAQNAPRLLRASEEYSATPGRFADYPVSLKKSGKSDEASDLEKRVGTLETASGTEEKVEIAIKAGDHAFQERRIQDAERSYKQAVDLAEDLPPGDQNLMTAMGRLGSAYAMQQKFPEASAMFHQQLALAEKTSGPESTASVEPLRFLGQLAAFQKNYKEAESYLKRGLDINTKMSGDNSLPAEESLRALAGLYMAEQDWPDAEIYLLRALKGTQASGPEVELIPLWGLCDMYDRWGKPEKSQPCWQRATGIMEVKLGHDSPQLSQPLTNEAQALRKLGRNHEAAALEERLTKIRLSSQH